MTSDYSQVHKDIDKEMRVLIKDYEQCKMVKDNKTDLMLKRIRLKHPIFQLITHSAFKFMMESSQLFKLKPGQTVYKESQPARANLYFVLYGQVEATSVKLKGARLGEVMGIGWILGEEILYSEDNTA